MKRPIIEIDEERCNGCGQCVTACAEGAIAIVDGKARLVSDQYCDGLGACLGDCPQGALRVVEREAEAFDEAAVPTRQEASAPTPPPASACPPSGCPGSRVRFRPEAVGDAPNTEDAPAPDARPSRLCHWPIQMELAPPQAPFFKDAHLLVAADCVGFSMPDFHERLLAGRTLVVCCPKLDDTQRIVEKLAAIFRAHTIRDVTVAIMEVPCCRALVGLVEQAMAAAGRSLPVKIEVIAT